MVQVIQYFDKGEVIIPEGVRGDRMYRILSGEVLVCKKNGNGKMVPIARLGEGEIFGEMYLFDAQGIRSASVIAVNSVQLEVFFQEDIEQDLQGLAPAMRQMLMAFDSRLRSTTGSYASLFKDKALVELPDGTVKIMDGRIQADSDSSGRSER